MRVVRSLHPLAEYHIEKGYYAPTGKCIWVTFLFLYKTEVIFVDSLSVGHKLEMFWLPESRLL